MSKKHFRVVHTWKFIMTADIQSITRMIRLPSQIKNHNCLVDAMLSIVLSPDPNMQAKRKSMQQDLDLENGYNILETKKPKLKGAKYMRVLCKEAYSTEETTGTVLDDNQ